MLAALTGRKKIYKFQWVNSIEANFLLTKSKLDDLD